MSEIDIIKHEINHSSTIAEYFEQNPQLSDLTQRRDYFSQLDSTRFVELTQEIYSLVESGTLERRAFDGDGVSAGLLEPPEQVDKEILLHEVWDAAQSFLKDTTLSDKDALIYAGLTVAGGLLYIHPAIDSNGRSSRVWSYMLMEGNNTNTHYDLDQILRENGSKYWHLTPSFNSIDAYVQSNTTPTTARIASQYNLTRNSFMNAGLETEKYNHGIVERAIESDMALETVALFINNLDDSEKQLLEPYIQRDVEDTIVSFDIKQALQDLVNQQEGGLRYASLLREAHRVARADFVRRFLYVMKDNSMHEPINKSLTKPSIETRTSLARRQRKAFAALAINGKLPPRDYYRTLFTANSGYQKSDEEK